HVEPALLRLLDLRDSGDSAVDGQDEAATVVGEPGERLAADAVALVETTRQVPRDIGTELAQQQDSQRRRCDPVDVVVAVDADPASRVHGSTELGARGCHVAEEEWVMRRLL